MYPRRTILYSVIAAVIGVLAVGGLLMLSHSQRTPAPTFASHAGNANMKPAPAQANANANAAAINASVNANTDAAAINASADAGERERSSTASAHSPEANKQEETDNPPAAEPGWPRQITDSRGTTTALQRQPQRIISLAPSATQILRAIGADASLIAIPREGSDPSEDESLVRLPVYPAPSAETVLSLRPDLLIGADITSPATAGRLRNDFNLPVIILSGNDYEGILADIANAGKATGHEATADVLSQILSEQLAAVQSEVAASKTEANSPQTLLFTGQSPDYAAGSGSYAANLLHIAGGENLALKLNQPWPQLSREFILEANPRVMIFAVNASIITSASDAPGRSDSLNAFLNSDPVWRQLDAVLNGRVYAIDQNLINVPGPNVGEALNRLRAIIRDVQTSTTQAAAQ